MPARVRLRWTHYVGASTTLAAGVVLKALALRPNFYSAAVYLSQSSANLMILTNFTFVTACTVLIGLQKLLYGPLRPIETEQLYEKAWFAVTETCLAMTIFRGDIGAWFLIMFFALLAGKVWGWIGEGRVETVEQQPPRSPGLFHTRLALSLSLGILYSFTMLEYSIKQVTRMAKPDMMVMFGFEFSILSVMSVATAGKYALHLIEIAIVRTQKVKRALEMQRERIAAAKRDVQEAERAQNEPSADVQATNRPSLEDAREALRRAERPLDEAIDAAEIEVEGWEAKGRFVFYFDLAIDFFKLVIYLSFFFILLLFYGLPIHIMRDVFLTARSFFKRISDFIKYREATRDMNERYPDATAEEIGTDGVCIICREEMRPYQPPAPAEQRQPNPVAERMRPKKLPCGHILHFSCLRSWLERQQVCPTCRRTVVPAQGTAAAPQGGVAGAGQGQHPPRHRPGPRVYQFGPLRIGVGAARGNNMLEELQRGLVDAQAAGGPAAAQNNNAVQQYGIGFGWDTRRRRRHLRGTVREHLDAVERQIQQDMQSLTASAQELVTLRQMQLELERIRANSGANNTATGQQAGAPAPQRSVFAPFRPTQWEPYQADRSQIVHAGSENLPPGMTLPEGWSMMPMRPVQAPAGPSPVAPATVNLPFGMPLPQGQPIPNPFAPEYIRAMFTGMPNQNAVNAAASPATTTQSNAAGQHTATAGDSAQSQASVPQAQAGPAPTSAGIPPSAPQTNYFGSQGQAGLGSTAAQGPSIPRLTDWALPRLQDFNQAQYQTWQDQIMELHRRNHARMAADARNESQSPATNTGFSNSTPNLRNVAEEHARGHEAWLASLMGQGANAGAGHVRMNGQQRQQYQNQQNSDATGSVPTVTTTAPTPTRTQPHDGTESNRNSQPELAGVNGIAAPSDSTNAQARSLPSWGSVPTPNDSHTQSTAATNGEPNAATNSSTAVPMPAREQSEGQNSVDTSGSRSGTRPGSSSSGLKHATVEDLVEDPD